MNNQMLFFFSALGAFNSFMLSLYFAINAGKKKFTNYFLSFLLLVLSIRIIKSVFFYFNPQLSNTFIQIGLSECILIGPFLFLYLQSQTSTKKADWIAHIIPSLTGITVLGILYPYVEHTATWSRWIVKGIYLQWLAYIIFSIKYIFPIFYKLKKVGISNNIIPILYGIKAGLPKPVAYIELLRLIKATSIDNGISEFKSKLMENKDVYNFNGLENSLNTIGYNYFSSGDLISAIKIFNLNIEQFPNSSNTHDSLGEAYYKNNQLDLALQHYKKSYELDPKNDNAKKMIEQILKTK